MVIVDSRTLWLAGGVSALATGTLLCVQYLVAPDERAMVLWGAGKMITGVGAVLVGLRQAISDTASVLGGNVLIVLGWTIIVAGSASFNGRRLRPVPTLVSVCAPALALAVLIVSLDMSPGVRTGVIGLVLGVVIVWSVVDCRRAQRRDVYFWRSMQIIVMIAWVLVLELRAGVATVSPISGDPAANSAFQVATTMGLMVATIADGIACMMLSRERVDRQLVLASIRDPETGLLNRAGLMQEYAALAERGATATVVLLDIDGFKNVNDTYGHLDGDRVLRRFGDAVRQHAPTGEIAARYGGDEFCLVLADCPLEDAVRITEAIRSEFASVDAAGTDALGLDGTVVTVSAGLSSVSTAQTTLDSAIMGADGALYRAKRAGRDRVAVAFDPC